MSTNGICVERGTPNVFLNERFSGMNVEEDTILRQKVKSWVIKVRDAEILRYWRISAQIYM